MKINTIYNESCLDTMTRMEDNFIDLTVTSPPYDDMRSYDNSIDKTWGEHIWKPIIKELHRVTKEGGVVVWVVADRTKGGNETGTSFKQALYAQECGFNLHDTMIYHKRAVGACGSPHGYNQSFEYMFIFSKGKLKTFNAIKDLVPERAGKPTRYTKKSKSNKDGYSLETHVKIAPSGSKRQNMWTYDIGYGSGDDKTAHSAQFPESLANDHIISWSNEGDLVYDPFFGSGTTGKMAKLNNRNWVGSEISSDYCKIAHERIKRISK